MIYNFIGPSGAGKKTQAKILAATLKKIYISTEDILQKSIKSRSKVGLKIEEYFKKSEMVPDSYIKGILENRINEFDCQKGITLAGYPKTLLQAHALDDLLDRNNWKMIHMFYLKIDDEEAMKRINKNEQMLKNLALFREHSPPILKFYRAKGLLREIDASGTTAEVAGRVMSHIDI